MKVIKTVPNENRYFEEFRAEVGNTNNISETGIINVYDDFEYQTVLGFGGAFTESAAYNYAQLTPKQKKDFMKKTFSRKDGIGYNFGRTHINSCDFSLDIYSYVENGDKDLSTFNIERERKYIIPFIKDALEYCKDELILFASPWSPPAYMKENEIAIRGGALKEEYKEVWARYYAKYIKAMGEEGIKISAITVQNEPNAKQPWESCSYSPEEERDFIEKYLDPILDEEGLSDIKIMIWDHNKERVYDRSKRIFTSEKVRNRVWGVAHHWYSGDHYEGLRLVHEKFGKELISTEICGSIRENPIYLAERYADELFGDFANFTSAFCDWNIMLSDKGGPYHNRNSRTTSCAGIVYEDKSSGCHAPILYDTENKELIYTPIYYYIGHFSKYVERGAKRIATTKYNKNIQAIAFKNPDGKIVSIVMNLAERELPAVIRYNDVCTKIMMEPHSIMTVLL